MPHRPGCPARGDVQSENGSAVVRAAHPGRAVQRAVAPEEQRRHWRHEPVAEEVNRLEIRAGCVNLEGGAAS